MNYNKKALEDLYNQVAGKPVAPRKHLDVLGEAKITIEYDDGKPEQINISDERARELRDIADISTTRNQALYKVDGKWVGRRASQKQLADIHGQMQEMSDMGKIDQKIVDIATTATIFDDPVSSFNETLKNIRRFLIDTAKLTLEKQGALNKSNKRTQERQIKKEVYRVLSLIERGDLQKAFVGYLDSKDDNTFNIWETLDPQNNDNKIYFALDSDVGKALQLMRPASDLAATRGAAGPGEALLAFLYGGVKPKGAGDILLSSGDEDSIELKKQEGRIGKHIKAASVKALEQLFYGKSPKVSEREQYLAGERGAEKGTVYKDIQQPLPVEIAKELKLADPNQTIFSKQSLANIQSDYKDNKNLQKHKWWYKNKWRAWNSLPNPSATVAAGKLKHTSSDVLTNMTVKEFLDKYSGVSRGEKDVNFNTNLPEQKVSDVLDSISGNTPRQKIANLIGVWHLKHYMSHIEPFKWLLVYKPDGTAAAVRYDTILNTPAIELIDLMNKKHLQFGVRPDDQGFHIEVH